MKSHLKHTQKIISLILVLAVCFSLGIFTGQNYQPIAEAAPQTPTTILDGYTISGTIYDMAVSGDIAYLGGNISATNFLTDYGAVVSSSTGAITAGDFAINDTVYAVASDGASGWYIGGSFTSVGGVERNYLAHIESDGSLDETWNPNADDVVSYIAVSGSDIYVNGDFTTIGGQSRAGLAKLNNTNGNADVTWNPNFDGSVVDIAVSGSDIFVAGSFTTIGGQSRAGLAKLNNTNGNADATWDPGPDGSVRVLYVSGSDIYAGGFFSTIGGQSRAGLAKLNNTNGNADATWDPDPNFDELVSSIVVSGSDIYVSGDFTTIGGQSRAGLAKLNNTNGNADATWDPNPDSSVNAIAVSGSDIFVGGSFESIGAIGSGLLAVDLITNELTDWHPIVSGEVSTLEISGSDIYIGGEFSAVDGTARNNLAKIDLDTGEVDATWDPNLTGSNIGAIAITGSDIYVSGAFTVVGGLARDNVAKLNNTNGNADAAFDMSTYFNGFGQFPSMDVLDSYLYIATTSAVTIGMTQYRSVFRTNRSTGEIDTSWSGGCTACGAADPYFVKVISPYIYVSGNFASYQAGAPSGRLIRLNLDGSVDTSWAPASDDRVYAIAESGSTVFAGGTFTSIGGQARNRLAALNRSDGLADSVWDPGLSSGVNALAVYESSILVGGNFTGRFKRYDFPEVSFSSATTEEYESAGHVSLPITLSAASDLDTTFDYTLTSGTATVGTDVTQTSGSITISEGDTSYSLGLDLVDDLIPESNETFTVTLSNLEGALLGDNSVLTFTIFGQSESTSSGSGGGAGSQLPVPPVLTTPTTPGITVPSTPTSPVLPSPMPETFTRDLQYGSNGEDVKQLQQFLNFRGFIVSPSGYGSPGNETIYFRSRTMRALQSFQRVYIDTLKEANGRLDGATRDLINFMASF